MVSCHAIQLCYSLSRPTCTTPNQPTHSLASTFRSTHAHPLVASLPRTHAPPPLVHATPANQTSFPFSLCHVHPSTHLPSFTLSSFSSNSITITISVFPATPSFQFDPNDIDQHQHSFFHSNPRHSLARSLLLFFASCFESSGLGLGFWFGLLLVCTIQR